jgi:hypothetical protein
VGSLASGNYWLYAETISGRRRFVLPFLKLNY